MFSLYKERAKLMDGQTVLDLGCGWGTTSFWLLETFPKSKVTAVSNSHTQREFIEKKALELGFSNRLTVITCDANIFETGDRFDRIIAIEMLEHMKNYEVLFRRLSSWLKPGGLVFAQVLCHNRHAYHMKTSGRGDFAEWMAEHFFSGGTMPSVDLFLYFQSYLSVQDQWIIHGTHYSKTLEAWLELLDQPQTKKQLFNLFLKMAGMDKAKAELDLQRWRIFFIHCSEFFGYMNGNEWLVCQYLFEKQPHTIVSRL